MDSPGHNGYDFELAVEAALRAAGYPMVRRGVLYYARDRLQRRLRKCQIDIEYFDPASFGKKLVECKWHDAEPVSLEEVAKFVAVLELLGRSGQGVLVSNQGFEPAARAYAALQGLELLTLEQLRRRRGRGLLDRLSGLF